MGFYVDDPAAAEVRPTDDVDVVIEITTDGERADLDERIRRAGLINDIEGPICRWRLDGLKVDIMPSNSDIFGFSNRWHPEVLRGALAIEVENLTFYIPHLCTFIATKLEAFAGRGREDFVASSDFEDIVRILDGCTTFEKDIQAAPTEVVEYVGQTFERWLSRTDFDDGLAAHLIDDGDLSRRHFILDRVGKLIALGQPGKD